MLKSIYNNIINEFVKLSSQRLPQAAGSIIILFIIGMVFGRGVTESGESAHQGFEVLSRVVFYCYSIAILFLLLISALSISSEFNLGTIRSSLTKPVTRTEFFTAKWLSLVLLGAAVILLITMLSTALVYLRYGLEHVSDKDFPDYVHIEKVRMLKYCAVSFLMMLLPVFAVVGFGVFVSTLFENSGTAVIVAATTAFGVYFITGSILSDIAVYLPNSYIDFFISALREASVGAKTNIWRFDAVLDLFSTQNVSPERRNAVVMSIVIPSVYAAVFFFLSLTLFKRKDILS